jgi:hypothetical protein
VCVGGVADGGGHQQELEECRAGCGVSVGHDVGSKDVNTLQNSQGLKTVSHVAMGDGDAVSKGEKLRANVMSAEGSEKLSGGIGVELGDSSLVHANVEGVPHVDELESIVWKLVDGGQ